VTVARSWVLAAVGVLVTALLAVAYRSDPVARWDLEVARWVGDSMPVWGEWLSRPFSWVGSGGGLAVVGVVAAVILARRGRRVEAALVVIAYIGSQLSTHLVKSVLDRPRPDFDPAVSLPGTAAYPSGHASAAVAVLLCLAVVWPVRGSMSVAVAVAIAIGLSRITLGVHWVSDVVGGWALGVAWLGLCLALRKARAFTRVVGA
jgi:undecaprenyl-diphosphatase